MRETITLSYFPGCSLATTAKENNQSLLRFCAHLGVNLVELEDWNCCGSSAAHSVDAGLAARLCGRNLALAEPDRPLMMACPGCYLRIKQTHTHIKGSERCRAAYEEAWQKPFPAGLPILHFFDLLEMMDRAGLFEERGRPLNGLRFVPYYGCMLARPPAIRRGKSHAGIMEKILGHLGAEALPWSHTSQCCGTFLTVARPDIVTPMVDGITEAAVDSGAECLVTACAMCHLNLEIRCTRKRKLPVFHFSEVLSLAAGINGKNSWFARHMVDPRPILSQRGIL